MNRDKNHFTRPKLLFWALLIMAVATATLFETGIFAKGGINVSDSANYFLQIAGVFITIGLIPIALKRFSAATAAAKESDEATFAKVYCHESEIRLALLFVVVMTNTGLYYGTANESALYCALAGLAVYIFSFPRKRAMQLMREE